MFCGTENSLLPLSGIETRILKPGANQLHWLPTCNQPLIKRRHPVGINCLLIVRRCVLSSNQPDNLSRNFGRFHFLLTKTRVCAVARLAFRLPDALLSVLRRHRLCRRSVPPVDKRSDGLAKSSQLQNGFVAEELILEQLSDTHIRRTTLQLPATNLSSPDVSF